MSAFLGRMSAPFVSGLLLAFAWPSTYRWTAAVLIGGVEGLPVLWPMVFHGLPQRRKPTDWLVHVFCGSFVLSCGASAALGSVAGELLRSPREPVQWLAVAAAMLFLNALLSGICLRATRKLGEELEKRPGGLSLPWDE